MINRETLRYKDFFLSRTLYNVEMKNVRTMNIFKASLELTKSIFSLAKENVPFYLQPTITLPLDEFKELFDFMRSFVNSFIPLRVNPERAFAPVHFSLPPKLEVDGYRLARLVDYKLAYEGLPNNSTHF